MTSALSPDLVTFLIRCSFTFGSAPTEAEFISDVPAVRYRVGEP